MPKLRVEIDPRQALGKMSRLDFASRDNVRKEVRSLTDDLQQLVVRKLSGEVLNVRSGALRASIKSEIIDNGYTGRVFSSGVPYAAIHEYGGIIDHPGSNLLQVFRAPDGKMVFTMFTRPHQIPIPERSYMRSSLNEMRDEIVARLTQATKNAANEAT